MTAKEITMAKPLYSLEDIISAGEQLEAGAAGASVLPWEVFQALGGRGKYDRVRDIWEDHVTARSSSPVSQATDLPADVDAEIARNLDTLGASIRQLFVTHFAGLAADHVRHLQLAHKQRADELASQGRELEFWRAKATAEEETQEEAKPKKAAPRRSRAKPATDASVKKPAPVSAKTEPKAAAKAKPKPPAAKVVPQVQDISADKTLDDPNQQQLPL
jgi:hypothetical protein